MPVTTPPKAAPTDLGLRKKEIMRSLRQAEQGARREGYVSAEAGEAEIEKLFESLQIDADASRIKP